MNITSVEVREVRLVKPFSLDDFLAGLPRPKTLSWLPPVPRSDVARELIAEQVPVDGSEVVEWMHYCAADLAVMDVFAQSVEDNGGKISFTNGDGYIPGVRLDSTFYARSEPGGTVASRGYAVVITPYGNVNVPVGGKQTIVFKDFLAWSSLTWIGGIQYGINLLRFDKLPKTPITSKISFVNTNGLVAPLFVSVAPKAPLPVLTMRTNLTSDKPQTLVLRGRSSSDYTNVAFEETVDVDAGENEFIMNVFGFPFVPSFVLEVQPEDRTSTTLNKLEVFP